MEINSKIGMTSLEYVHITISQIRILGTTYYMYMLKVGFTATTAASTTTLESSTTRVSREGL